MRRYWIAKCFAMVAMATQIVSAQGSKLDFELMNQTTLTIAELYVSPAADDEWGEDILGKDVLPNGQSVEIVFSPKAQECMWDLKIVDEDDDDVIWTRLDLCKASHITLLYRNGQPTAIVK